MSEPGSSQWSDVEDVVLIDQDDVSNYNHDNILPETPQSIAEIRAWLKPTEYNLESGEYRKHLAAHLPGTGAWLTSLDQYRQWHDGKDHGLLWIRGIPGSGKSVFAANLAHTFSQEGAPVLFFFFRQIIHANHQPINLLRDWLDQVLRYSPPLQVALKAYVDGGRSLDSVSVEDLWRHLRTALAQLPLVYCVADALDEMDQGNADFISSIVDLAHWRPSHIKVLMTSRPVAAVETPMRQKKYIDIRLEERLVDIDIATYVRFCMEHSLLSEDHQTLIKQAVPGRANGLFLYAKLAMDAFLEPEADISSVLARLPLDLNELYSKLLEEHARRSGIPAETQLLILRWVTHAIRPLRLLELADLIKATALVDTHFSLKDTKKLVRTTCGPLLEILPDETISVVHHSLTEFLVGATRTLGSSDLPILEFASTHCQLTIACLKYMSGGCLLHETPTGTRREIKSHINSMTVNFPFSAYAIDDWYLHASRADWTGNSARELYANLDMFLADEPRKHRWIRLCWIDPHRLRRPLAVESISNLHIAAFCGLADYTEKLLDRHGKESLDSKDESERTPLWLASTRGHSQVVSVLLKAGADPNAEDSQGSQPLHEAANNNHHEVIELLLDVGVDPMTQKSKKNWRTRLVNKSYIGIPAPMSACQNGHLEALEAFLPYLTHDAKQRALVWAAESSRPRVVTRILQEPGVDPNEKVRGVTALFIAASNGDVGSIEALVNAGADARILCERRNWPDIIRNRRSKDVRSCYLALQEFCRLSPISRDLTLEPEQYHLGFTLLVQAGGDVLYRYPNGSTALHNARSPVIMRLLIDAGADVNAETIDGRTALHGCPHDDEGACLDLLMQGGGTDLNKKDFSEGNTPLMLALKDCDMALRMLEYGPDCNITDHMGNSALHRLFWKGTCRERFDRLLPALLKAGADPMLLNANGATLLHALADNKALCSEDLVRLVVGYGIDIDSRDAKGRTPVFTVISNSTKEKDRIKQIEAFRAISANLHIPDAQGRSILHEAVRCFAFRDLPTVDTTQVYKYLVDAGMSPLALDLQGNTLLHETMTTQPQAWAMESGFHLEILDIFSRVGLKIDQANLAGVTPLHILCQKRMTTSFGAIYFLDWILERTASVNTTDFKGLAAIHYAASVDVYSVERLIGAGADPFISTVQGMNALHIASRCRLSNTVGYLLEHMVKVDPLKTKTALNQKDISEHTPLHYACRSGRPETVTLLLMAGADPNPTTSCGDRASGNPWLPPILQILFFDEEQRLWVDSPEKNGFAATCFTVESNKRPNFPRRGRGSLTRGEFHPTNDYARFEEITQLLVAAGANPNVEINDEADTFELAMKDAIKSRDDYTTNIMIELHDQLHETKLDDAMTMARARRQWEKETFRKVHLTIAGDPNREVVHRLLSERHYSLIKHLYDEGADFTARSEHGEPVLQTFASSGLSNLLDECCSAEEVARFENAEWCARWERGGVEGFGHRAGSTLPLLQFACKSELPNMEVIRVLVEKKGANVNAQSRFIDSGNPRPHRTALHILARGRYWWQVAQAIPYLASKGANLDIRERDGNTALHLALEAAPDGFPTAQIGLGPQPFSVPPFRRQAARALIGLGADVNAVDNLGVNCLTKAKGDPELIKLLIDHGAVVDRPSIVASVRALDLIGLNELLSAEGNSKTGRSWNRTLSGQSVSSENLIELCEEHPLCIAANPPCSTPHPAVGWDKTGKRIELMEALMDAGLSLYDTFLEDEDHEALPSQTAQTSLLPEVVAQDNWAFDLPLDKGEARELRCVVERTVLHQILSHYLVSEPIIQLRSLDLEYRDAAGRTPLLASCRRVVDQQWKSDSTPVRVLLERGADPCAVDYAGRNVLHHLLGCTTEYEDKFRCLGYLGDAVSDLINQADGFGYYPIHYALASVLDDAEFGKQLTLVEHLISSGADITVADADGNRALHYLTSQLANQERDEESNSTNLFKKLVDAGLDVNARNHEGQTPLHMFRPAINEDVDEERQNNGILRIEEAMQMLKEMGVDWHARDSKGRTVLHELAAHCADAFKAVLKMGVDALLEDVEGRSSLDIAAAYRNGKVLALFKRKKFNV
ncbi:hypothetical protein G7046_g7911 [Stylonectria norvegica]|nr:hypothetical protein G7046_g7911 [Stylonectria norvegica]